MTAPTREPASPDQLGAWVDRMKDLMAEQAVAAAKAQGEAVSEMLLDDFGAAAKHFERAARCCRQRSEAKRALLISERELGCEVTW